MEMQGNATGSNDMNTNENNNMYSGENAQNLYNECKRMMYYHVVLRLKDGTEVDGIMDGVDPNQVSVLTGEDVIDRNSGNDMQRQYMQPMRYRRFRRRNFPLADLLAVTLLNYPYYAPPYSYYPYYPYSY